MLHANLMALCSTEPELLLIKVLHCENRDFQPVYSCDLDLDLMTFINEPDPYSWRYIRCAKIDFLHQGFQKLSFDRHTDSTEIIYHAASQADNNNHTQANVYGAVIVTKSLASCLIYARALLEYVFFTMWVCSVSKMLPSMKFA